MECHIRHEIPADYPAIDDLLDLAFAFDAHSRLNEAAIVRQLRAEGLLSLSMVAVSATDQVIGHIAFSPVRIDTGAPGLLTGWYGLGPMAVNPRLQRQGIGRQLIEAGLGEIRQRQAAGCVVLGEPGFYERFGFVNFPELILPGAPVPFFMACSFTGPCPAGQVIYAGAFSTT